MTTWPNYLKNLLPGFLETINYPFSGVGDLQDLAFVPVQAGGQWSGTVNSGWYYFQNNEQYNYITQGLQVVSTNSGTGTVNSPTSSYRPAWGPVLAVSDIVSGQVYTQHSNCFFPGTVCNWTQIGSTGYWYTNVPTGCVVSGARNLTNSMLGVVGASGQILNENFIAYNVGSQLVVIRPVSGSVIQVFLDLLYFEPRIQFSELVVQVNNKLTPSYNYPGLSQVVVNKGSVSAAVGSVTGSFSNPLLAWDGDWFVLTYYIDYSYCLVDHNTLQYWVPGSDNFNIYWEQSPPNSNHLISLTSDQTDIFNVNPLFGNSYRSGYLFAAEPGLPIYQYWTPSKLTVMTDKSVVYSDLNEYVAVTLILIGDNDLPVPGYPISFSTSSCTGIVLEPNNFETDNRGEFHALYRVPNGVFTFSASAGLLTASASSTCKSLSSTLNTDIVSNAFINMYVSPSLTSENSNTVYMSVTNIDGVPINVNTASTSGGLQITINSLLNSEFINGFGTSSVELTDSTALVNLSQSINNPAGIVQVGYVKQSNDQIMANIGTAQSVLVKP